MCEVVLDGTLTRVLTLSQACLNLPLVSRNLIQTVSFFVSSPDACGDLMVTLQSVSRQGEKRSLQLSAKSNSATFMFENVLPGKYKSEDCGWFITCTPW